MSNGPLHGIRVIDWTTRHMGPAGGMYLAGLGADVIHVEQKGVGDTSRDIEMVCGVPVRLHRSHSTFFDDLNKNKRGMSIDLAKPQGKEVMYRLVQKSDVLITNFRLRAVRKLGMDYEALRGLNPRLIYGQVTSCGERGPEKDGPGNEVSAVARSGILFANGHRGDGPTYPAVASGAHLGGLFLAFGVITAMVVRERTGKGQRFSTSQLGAMISNMGHLVSTALLSGGEIRSDKRTDTNPLSNWYRCRDGRWLAISLVLEPDRHWPAFCRAVDRPDLGEDSRFGDTAGRNENRVELVSVLDRHFATRDCEEWEKRLREGGDFIFSRVNTLSDVIRDPQVLANDYIVDFDHPVLGKVKEVALPFDFSETPVEKVHSPAPDLGQHNVEILRDILGYSNDEIMALRQQDSI